MPTPDHGVRVPHAARRSYRGRRGPQTVPSLNDRAESNGLAPASVPDRQPRFRRLRLAPIVRASGVQWTTPPLAGRRVPARVRGTPPRPDTRVPGPRRVDSVQSHPHIFRFAGRPTPDRPQFVAKGARDVAPVESHRGRLRTDEPRSEANHSRDVRSSSSPSQCLHVGGRRGVPQRLTQSPYCATNSPPLRLNTGESSHRGQIHLSSIVSHHATRLIHRDCVALNFTILEINAYGIFCSMGNRRLPFSPAYRATAFSSAGSPFTGGYSPMWCLNAAK
jgi:hypothetical protein